MMQQPEPDKTGAPSGLDAAMEADTSLPDQKPAPPLRVFISYKEKDWAATSAIKKVLSRIGGDNIHVFVSGDEQGATQWRESILQELRKAHLLIFLYTDPAMRWDWCLYETGYFDAMQKPAELDRRLWVFHGKDVPPSGPFLGLKTVPIDTSDSPDDTKLKNFLEVLFERSTIPAVSTKWDEGGCADLLTAMAAPFRRYDPVEPEEYIRKLTFRLKRDATGDAEAVLKQGRIPADAVVSGNQKSFKLFGFGATRPRTWKDLEDSWRREISTSGEGSAHTDPVKIWVENVAQKMLQAINGEDFDDGLPLFFSKFAETEAQALFRPSLAQLCTYSDAFEFEVAFVDVPKEYAAASHGPLTTVGSLLRLAHMFRFGWIEETARDVVDRPPAKIGEAARDMARRLNGITAESFNQGISTESAVLRAFEKGSELHGQVDQAMKTFQMTVAPAIESSFKEKDTDKILDALKQASAVNWQFHRACAQRYLDIVDKHCREGSGPLDPV